MKNLEEFFTEGAILDYLCKLRARVAKKRNEKHLIHLLSDSGAFNYHVNDEVTHSKNEYIEYQKKFISDLCKLLPSRKQWVKLGKSARLNSRTSQPISSNDKNVYSLLKTIKKARKNGSSAPWLKELNAFISDVKISVIDGNYLVSPPVIYPKSKDKITRNKKSECRPISLYTLKDRVIMSIANKYLTSLLDRYFENSSFAFRSKNKEGTTLTHHDCIREIVSFRTKNEGKDLWVVECDMDKFFDSVSHRKIMWQFAELILKVQNDYPELDMSKSILLFELLTRQH